MERIIRFIHFHKTVLVFFLCLIISTILIFSNQTSQVLVLRTISADVAGSVTQKLNWVVLLFAALEENKQLKSDNLRLNFENDQLRVISEQNQRLRELLDFKQNTKYEFKSGHITHWNSPLLSTVTIDLGSRDGVTKNDPVITNNGLVGKIIESGSNFSICQLLTDGSFRVSSQLKRAEIMGFLSFLEDNIAVLNVNGSAVVTVGDTVVSSRHGNIYPFGIPIGTVSDFTREPGLFKTVFVNLFVKYDQLQEVSVILNKNPSDS